MLLLTEPKIDILCLSETWMDSTIPDSQIHIPGYTLERKDRNREGGRVLMYVCQDISYDVRANIASVSDHVESLWVEAKLSPSLPCQIACIYIVHPLHELNISMVYLTSWIKPLLKTKILLYQLTWILTTNLKKHCAKIMYIRYRTCMAWHKWLQSPPE